MNYFEDELWDFQEGIELISLTKAKSLKRDLNKMKDFSFFKKTYESYIADLKDLGSIINVTSWPKEFPKEFKLLFQVKKYNKEKTNYVNEDRVVVISLSTSPTFPELLFKINAQVQEYYWAERECFFEGLYKLNQDEVKMVGETGDVFLLMLGS